MLLINKGLSKGDVITLKLNSGEELIGKLVEETDTVFKVAKPMVLTMSGTGVGMTPYLFTVNQNTDIPVNKTAVVVAIASDKEMGDSYLTGTTGIALR